MSGATLAAGAPAGVARGAGASRVRPATPLPLLVELSLFAALAVLGMAQWARLVEPAATGPLLLALLVVCVAGAALRALDRLRPGWRRRLAAAAVALAGLAGALLAAGLPAELLAPGNWGEFREYIRASVGGIEQAQLPYGGPDEWIRLSLVLGAPALIALAATVAFWPGARGGASRATALAILLIAYGVGVTLDNPGTEVIWGIGLLVLSAAWLWIARLGPGQRLVALGVTLAAGLVVLPVAARLNAEAWWDYENWSWFGAERTVRFQWNHEYGPLEWPREGTTLMLVESEQPLYWKASVLDRFDGYTWSRAAAGDTTAAAELGARGIIPGGPELDLRHPDWVEEATFELRALSSDLVIGAGVTRDVEGTAGTLASADGTLTHVGPPLERGDEYTITSYVPQPTPDQLRDAPVPASPRRFAGTTLVGLPSSLDSPTLQTVSTLWGRPNPAAEAALLASPYAEAYRLARRWTADAATPYDAVRTLEERLRSDYDYTPTVDNSSLPLLSFLFEDEAGYCQQFAGAMGLMTRMLGIPSRVVSGFAPGSPDSETGTYEVRDFDAHSWVEVYFRGIGWVTFDPTPGAAPAESQHVGGEFPGALSGPTLGGAVPESTGGFRRGDQESGTSAPLAERTTFWDVALPVLLIALATGCLAWTVVAGRRRRALRRGELSEEQLAELGEALRRAGWELSPRATLLAIERRAGGHDRAAVREYAAALRGHRYGPSTAAPPGPRERRALRKALGAGGLRARLRALLAIPPGGPARA
jgi:transglutaminase-like putative cysteine protease